MSFNPLVSIVIPVFNGANYVGQAIESALQQTYAEKEILVIDDGSNDAGATRAVVESFGDSIRYVTKPNGGVATALNVGIEQMRGHLFSWLSHDDLYRPEKVARQVDTWQNFGQPCVVIGDFELMDADAKPFVRRSIAGYNLIARPLDSVFRGLINGCTLLVPRELFQKAGLFEPGLPTTQDYHLWYRMARLAPFVHCAHADVLQRVHPLQGSRHLSHLDEASRMFVHLVDVTPPRLMQAYDGSELRFLLRTREALNGYPGLHSYLSYRIATLLKQVRYSVVIWGASGLDEAAAQLNRILMPPADIVRVRTGQPDSSATDCGFAQCANPSDIVEAAHSRLTTDIVLFAHATRLPSEEQIRAALEGFIAADADAARPAGVPVTLTEADGLIALRDVLPVLATKLRSLSLGSPKMAEHLQIGSYAAVDPVNIETAEEIRSALRGESAIRYHVGLSEAAIADLATEGHDRRLPTLLFIQHSLGGGAQVHMNLLIRALAGKANTMIVYGASGGILRLSVNPEVPDAGIVFHAPGDLPPLVRILQRSGVVRADVHHAIGFEKAAEILLDGLQVPFDVTLVDYHLVANSPFLCTGDGKFVGDEHLFAPSGGLLRRRPFPILGKASRILAISRDLAERFARLHKAAAPVPVRLWHEDRPSVRKVFVPRLWGNEPLRIVIAGNIVPHKGRDVILAAAREAAARNLPLQFHITGQLQVDWETRDETDDALTVHGSYGQGDFSTVLGRIAPHVGWLPAQVPETWSYVLSEFMDAALPVAASAIGAIPERCYGRSYTWLLPWNASAGEWVNLFLRIHASGMQEPSRWMDISHLPEARDFYFSEYLYPGGREFSV